MSGKAEVLDDAQMQEQVILLRDVRRHLAEGTRVTRAPVHLKIRLRPAHPANIHQSAYLTSFIFLNCKHQLETGQDVHQRRFPSAGGS